MSSPEIDYLQRLSIDDLSKLVNSVLVQAQNDTLDNAIEQVCLERFPLSRVDIGEGMSFARVTQTGEIVPYLQKACKLFNVYLPEINDRVSISKDFSPRTHKLADGRMVDLGETWKGNSFLLFAENELVGVTIGRRECEVSETGRKYSNKGFLVLSVIDPQYQATRKSILLVALPAISLINSGVRDLRGSCAVTNSLADKMYSRFAYKRWIDGNFVRYIFDPDKIEAMFLLVKKTTPIDSSAWEQLIGEET